MSHYIGEYTKTCDLCLRTKVQRQPPIGKLHPFQVPTTHWDTLSMDFIVELPEAHGFDAVMNVVDSVSKCAHFIPTNTTITAVGATCLFPPSCLEAAWPPPGRCFSQGCAIVHKFTSELYRLQAFASQPLLPITPRWMVKLNESTKNWNSTFASL